MHHHDSGDILSAVTGFVYGVIATQSITSTIAAIGLTIITTAVGYVTKKSLDYIWQKRFNKNKDEKEN